MKAFLILLFIPLMSQARDEYCADGAYTKPECATFICNQDTSAEGCEAFGPARNQSVAEQLEPGRASALAKLEIAIAKTSDSMIAKMYVALKTVKFKDGLEKFCNSSTTLMGAGRMGAYLTPGKKIINFCPAILNYLNNDEQLSFMILHETVHIIQRARQSTKNIECEADEYAKAVLNLAGVSLDHTSGYTAGYESVCLPKP